MFNKLKLRLNKFDFWKKDPQSEKYSVFFRTKDLYDSPYYRLLISAILKEVRQRTTKDQEILDAGCGEGYLTRLIHDLPRKVSGFDVSTNLIEVASSKNQKIQYWIQDLEENAVRKKDKKFSMILSNLVLMDLQDINAAVKTMAVYLKNEGTVIITISHPCFYQESSKDWFDETSIKNLCLNNYFEEKVFYKKIAGQFEIYHFHRTLQTYLEVFRKNKLTLVQLLEPQPDQAYNPLLKKAAKIPFFIIFILKKSKE